MDPWAMRLGMGRRGPGPPRERGRSWDRLTSSFTRFALRALGLTLVVAGIAALLATSWVGSEAVPAVVWASGIALAGALLGRLAGRLVPGGRPESPAQAAMVGIGVRLIATAGACFAAFALGVAPRPTFVATVLVQYLALLVLEVGQAVAEVRSAEAALPGRRDGGAAS